MRSVLQRSSSETALKHPHEHRLIYYSSNIPLHDPPLPPPSYPPPPLALNGESKGMGGPNQCSVIGCLAEAVTGKVQCTKHMCAKHPRMKRKDGLCCRIVGCPCKREPDDACTSCFGHQHDSAAIYQSTRNYIKNPLPPESKDHFLCSIYNCSKPHWEVKIGNKICIICEIHAKRQNFRSDTNEKCRIQGCPCKPYGNMNGKYIPEVHISVCIGHLTDAKSTEESTRYYQASHEKKHSQARSSKESHHGRGSSSSSSLSRTGGYPSVHASSSRWQSHKSPSHHLARGLSSSSSSRRTGGYHQHGRSQSSVRIVVAGRSKESLPPGYVHF